MNGERPRDRSEPGAAPPGGGFPAAPSPPGRTLEAEDPCLAREIADLLDPLRRIPVPEPTGKVFSAVKGRILRRRSWTDPLKSPADLLEVLLLFAGRAKAAFQASRGVRSLVYLLLLLLLLRIGIAAFGAAGGTPSKPSRETVVFLPKPTPERTLPRSSPRMRPDPARLAWLGAQNDLQRLRRLLDPSGKGDLRQRLARTGVVDGRTRRRIADLSRKVREGLEGNPSLADLALGLRALILTGSTPRRGPAHRLVRSVLDRLQDRLPKLAGEDRVHALAGFLEGALVSGGYRLAFLRREVVRFVREEAANLQAAEEARFLLERRRRMETDLYTLRVGKKDSVPPSLASWAISSTCLADAGLLLRLAPALGADPVSAARLRKALLEHLRARTSRGGSGGAVACAALLFGYGDLVDRPELFHRLELERRDPSWLEAEPRAIQFLAWASHVEGKGWARFERALRRHVASAKPSDLHGAASLLLAQMVYLAPMLDRSD